MPVSLTISRSRVQGGAVFALTAGQWQEAVSLAGGWPEDLAEELISPADVADAADRLDLTGEFDVASMVDARDRVSRTIAARQGQPHFRAVLVAAYDGRCAVTGCAVIEILEAAHIHPYTGPRSNDVRNGLLLPADIHTLFDWGLLTVNPSTWSVVIAEALVDSEYAHLADTPPSSQ
jgi:predicted restriction endonuclease